MSLKEGRIIEFKDKKRIISAVCISLAAKTVRVISELNKEFTLPINKISHITDYNLNLSKPRLELIDDLNDKVYQAEEISSEIELADLWELLKDENEEKFDLSTLTEIYFGNNAASEMRSAMFRLLVADNVYFDAKNDNTYIPKTTEKVEKILLQKSIEEKKEKQKRHTIEWLKNIWQGNTTEEPEGTSLIIEHIREIAILGNRSERYNEGVNLLQDIGIKNGDPAENAIKLMTKLGLFDEDENLLLLEYKIPVEFSNNLMETIKDIELDTEVLQQREDLTELETITIDDDDTRDIDDAISFLKKESGYQIGIHIADPAEMVQPSSLLDKEAMTRSTSIYLPEKVIEMIPARLSEELCSLVANQKRLALSILIELDHNYEIIGFDLRETVINVKRRLSYQEADQIFESEPLLLKLSQIADQLRNKRLQQGALIFNLPDLKIKVSHDKQISIKKYRQSGPSQMFISEFMILANSLVAKFCSDHDIPCIYRFQEEPEEIVDFSGELEPIIMMYRQRRFMKRSETSTRPKEHHGLGLKYYTQITSPIRRYSDLAMHRQLKSFLRNGTPFYKEEELKEIIYFTEHSLNVANIIQRYANRYWLSKYLSQYQGYKTTALVLDEQEERYIIQLTELLLELPLFKEMGSKLAIGQLTEVIIKDTKPRRGFIALRLAREQNTETLVLN